MNLYCPFCEAMLQDSVAGWWCVTCDQAFSAAEIEATP